jgi:uncharacterized membrane protein (DUF4010 family)
VNDLNALLPPDVSKIVVVLFLSFLVGIEREEHKATSTEPSFGGVRTFPLIGLVGYAAALLSGPGLLLVAVGFGVVGAFMLMSYRNKIQAAQGLAGATSEMSGLAIYLVGALVQYDHFWVATTLVVLGVMLLELKGVLERLSARMAPEEILTFAKFLLLTAVILPVLPNRDFGPFAINPFKTWLVIVAVSGVSYGSYVLQKVTKPSGGILLAAILGGAYSSTVMTVVLARRGAKEHHPHLFSGGMLVASGMMYLRLAALVALFNRTLVGLLAPAFLVLAATGILAGWIWTRVPDDSRDAVHREFEPGNPLELRAALFFGCVFIAMLVATHLATTYLGKGGIYALAAVLGLADVDPFIMGMTQAAGTGTPLGTAAVAIIIAAASNNVAKGVYAVSFSERATGLQGLAALTLLGVGGLTPLVLGAF